MRIKRQSFLQGAMTLTAATMVVKVIGMLYRIPLGNLLGASGLSYFNSAYSIFNPIYALSVSGLPVAVSKMVSERMARRRFADVRRIRRVSRRIFLLLGVAGGLLLYLLSGWFASIIGNQGATPAVAVMAPSILFCCIMASYRGYYQGLGNMTPTALSQVVESLVKLCCGVAFAWLTLQRGMGEYAAQGTVFGQAAASLSQAEQMVLPWAAAGAILGVTVSTAAGALLLFLRSAFLGDGISREEIARFSATESNREIVRGLWKIALPICLASAFSYLTNLIDLATIMNRIGVALHRDGEAVLQMFAGAADHLPRESVPSFLYGLFAYVTPLFNLIPAITATLGVSALPILTTRWALGERKRVAEQCVLVLKLAALVAIPAGIGLCALSEPILRLLYFARPEEAALAAPLLRSMGLAGIFVGITTPMSSLFQALGRADLPLKLMVAGGAVKICCNWVLVAVPALNIYAAPVGTLLCYFVVLAGGTVALGRVTGTSIGLHRVLIKPMISGILCGIAANTSYMLLIRVWDSRLITVVAVAIGALFYAVFGVFFNIITKNEALFLPNGKKIGKILENLSRLR
jgi:stage V sporulation protein B